MRNFSFFFTLPRSSIFWFPYHQIQHEVVVVVVSVAVVFVVVVVVVAVVVAVVVGRQLPLSHWHSTF